MHPAITSPPPEISSVLKRAAAQICVPHRATGEFYLQAEEGHLRETSSSPSTRVLKRDSAHRPLSGEWLYDLATDTTKAASDWWHLRGHSAPGSSRSWDEWQQAIHPEDRYSVSTALRAVRQGKSDHFSVEYRERRASGDWVWISSFGWLQTDGTGSNYMVGADTDISHLKSSEEAVAALSRKLELALQASGVGLWEIHLDTGRFECDEALRGMYGFGPECGDSICFGMWRSRLHPEDREKAVRAAHDAMSNCHNLQQSFRILLPGGAVRNIITSCRYYVNPDGLPRFLGVDRDVTTTHEREAQLYALAYNDPLTGLPNRVLFQQELERVVERRPEGAMSGALLLLDLDRFKEINDSLGHAAGDELLQLVAGVLQDRCRGRHFVARVGGDEFAVIVEHCSNVERVSRLADDLVALLDRTLSLHQGDVVVSTSIGVARFPVDGTTRTELLSNADLALYHAKECGRSRAEFFERSFSDDAQARLAISLELRAALATGEGLAVHYQPQIELATRRVVGFEALVRWNHERRGPISPGEFIPIAEQSQLICDLGLWVLREATRQARAWIEAGEPERPVSVNVSVAQIWLSDFVSDVKKVLDEVDLKPHLLCLELTESLLVDHVGGRVRNVLEQLSALGIRLALDDFGTGYSSLGYLRRLPFSTLKVDRVFVRESATSARGKELLSGIVALGRGLDMTVVAEGAESADEVALLDQIACDRVQGFVFARPSEADQALEVARKMVCE